MNVQQFNTGSPVSLWAYFVIALPLTVFSLLAIQFHGSWKTRICTMLYEGSGYWRHARILVNSEFVRKFRRRRWPLEGE